VAYSGLPYWKQRFFLALFPCDFHETASVERKGWTDSIESISDIYRVTFMDIFEERERAEMSTGQSKRNNRGMRKVIFWKKAALSGKGGFYGKSRVASHE